MRLTIKNAKTACVELAPDGNCFDVYIQGATADNLLAHVDIIDAIKYYGIMELLDTIGEEELRSHLALGVK